MFVRIILELYIMYIIEFGHRAKGVLIIMIYGWWIGEDKHFQSIYYNHPPQSSTTISFPNH